MVTIGGAKKKAAEFVEMVLGEFENDYAYKTHGTDDRGHSYIDLDVGYFHEYAPSRKNGNSLSPKNDIPSPSEERADWAWMDEIKRLLVEHNMVMLIVDPEKRGKYAPPKWKYLVVRKAFTPSPRCTCAPTKAKRTTKRRR